MTDEIILSAEEEKTYQAFYQRRRSEVLGELPPLREELTFAQDLLQAVVADGLTPDANGAVSYFRRDGLDWTDPEAVKAMGQAMGQAKPATAREASGGAKDMLLGVAMLLAVLVGGWWYFFGSKGAATEAEAVALTPEIPVAPEAGATPTPLPTLEAELLADIVDASGVKTSLVVPRTLEVGGVSFVVQPVTIKSGDWPLPDDERVVSWVYGTVVNYVLGLEATAENKALLAGLKPGAELLLRMSTGPTYRFAFAGAVRVAPQASEIFRQTQPGLTLVLMGEEGQPTRVVIRALYLPESELGPSPVVQAPTTPLGQAVTLDEMVRLTPLAARPIASANTPPGYVTLAVHYAVENVSDYPLRPALFRQHLEANGLTFAATSPPVQAGTYPPLPEQLAPGRTLTTTTAYALPERILRQESVWTFAPDLASPTAARVAIPAYGGPLTAQFELEAAMAYGDFISATVQATAPLTDLTVEAADLHLTGASLDPIQSRLPWFVAAGQTEQFPLWLKPQADQMQLTLFEQGFELKREPMTNDER